LRSGGKNIWSKKDMDAQAVFVTREYPYKPSSLVMLLSGLFFAVCGVVLFRSAQTNETGLTVDFIALEPGEATVFLWFLVAASIGFVLIALAGLYVSLTSQARIILTATTLSVPRLLSSQSIVIPLASITGLELISAGGQRFIRVRHGGGKVDIAKSKFADAAAYEDFRTALFGLAGMAPATGRSQV
jgi:hypothetical protein